jgi:hypothetical protein
LQVPADICRRRGQGALFCSRDVQAHRAVAVVTPVQSASDNTTLLHWSYSNAATFLPWLISAGRFGQRGDWLGSAHLRRGHVPSRQSAGNSFSLSPEICASSVRTAKNTQFRLRNKSNGSELNTRFNCGVRHLYQPVEKHFIVVMSRLKIFFKYVLGFTDGLNGQFLITHACHP